MDRISLATAKHWVKTSHHPLAQSVKRLHFALRFFELPFPRFLLRYIYQLFRLLQMAWGHFTRIIVWTPLFKSQLTRHRGQLICTVACLTAPGRWIFTWGLEYACPARPPLPAAPAAGKHRG